MKLVVPTFCAPNSFRWLLSLFLEDFPGDAVERTHTHSNAACSPLRRPIPFPRRWSPGCCVPLTRIGSLFTPHVSGNTRASVSKADSVRSSGARQRPEGGVLGAEGQKYVTAGRERGHWPGAPEEGDWAAAVALALV